MIDAITFYNGGNKFTEKFTYTKPDTNFAEENGIAYLQIVAERKGFFEVPYEIQVGDTTHRLSVHKEVTAKFGERGVIRIEPRLETVPETPEYQYVANTKQMAVEKGDEIWKNYLRRLIEEFEFENLRRQTERGLSPLRPRDFIAHAYKELGMMPPGDERLIKPTEAAAPQSNPADIVKQLEALVTKQAAQIKEQNEKSDLLLKKLAEASAGISRQGEDDDPEIVPETAPGAKEPEKVTAKNAAAKAKG